MNGLSMTRKTQTGLVVLTIVLAVAVIRQGPNVWAHEDDPGAIESYLHGMVEGTETARRLERLEDRVQELAQP